MSENKTFGDRLRTVRKHAGASQQDIANHLDTSVNVISSAETNKSQLNAKNLENFMRYTNVNREWLLHGGDISEIGEICWLGGGTTNSTMTDNPWRDALVEQLKAENLRLQQEALRVWGMVSHLTGGKIPGFLKAIKEAGQPVYHLPGKEHGRSLIAQA